MDEDRVDRRLEGIDTRGEHDLGAGGHQFALVHGPFHAHVAGIIAGAEGDALQPPAGGADGPRPGDAEAGFEDRH